MEEKVLKIANALSNQRHLRAIRNAFISILPITIMGGLFAVISSAPVTDDTTNGFLLAWSSFVKENNMIFSWVNTLTLGAIAVYVCLAITYFLCKHFKLDILIPMTISFYGVMLLTINPVKLAFDKKVAEISYMDGKGLLVGIAVAIITVEVYRIFKEKKIGVIKMPPSVPPSLTETFASLFTSVVIMMIFTIGFIIFNKLDTTFAIWLIDFITPTLKATDSIWFILTITIIINIGWFFGIHNATFWGLVGPIMFMNLSANASAHAAGMKLSGILTEPFWAYFVAIGGVGQVLSLGIILSFSKSKQMKTIGRMGVVPAFFGISEPITFGLPIMLNPVFFLPSFLTAAVNATITFLLMNSGFIGKTYAMLSFNMPSIFGAYFSTSDFKAVILIVALLVIDMLIYFPFTRMYEKQQLKLEEEAE